MIALWLGSGVLGAEQQGAVSASLGDDARGPVLYRRPKVERELEAVLEAVEQTPVNERTTVKRKAVKDAREAVRAIEAPVDMRPAFEAISQALSALSRKAAEYEAFRDAQMRVAVMIESAIAEMERKRLKRRREEELLVTWLLN
jgi:uncharacterized linocin/CFP29 family protein